MQHVWEGRETRTKFWSENLKEGDHSVDLGVDGKTISEWILGNNVTRCGLDSSVLGQEPVAGSCEHGNEPSGSVRTGNFLIS
jgi:hypothetical protein